MLRGLTLIAVLFGFSACGDSTSPVVDTGPVVDRRAEISGFLDATVDTTAGDTNKVVDTVPLDSIVDTPHGETSEVFDTGLRDTVDAGLGDTSVDSVSIDATPDAVSIDTAVDMVSVDATVDSTYTCAHVTCGTNATCSDAGGTPVCSCNEGYIGDGMTCTPAGITGALTTGDPGRWQDGKYATSCQKYQFPSAPYQSASSNGYYAIDHHGTGIPNTVYCDLTTDGGAWTCIDPTAATSGFNVIVTNLLSDSNCGVDNGMPQAHKTGSLACRFDFNLGFTFNTLRASGLIIEAVTGGAHVSDLAPVDSNWGTPYCATPATGDVLFGSSADTRGRLSLARANGMTAPCTPYTSYANDAQIDMSGTAVVARGSTLRLEFGEAGGEDEGWRWASGMICMRDGVQLAGGLTASNPATFEDGSVAGSCREYRTPTGGMRVYAGSTGDGVYTIDSDGSGGNAPYEVYCDMTTDGGGWTLLGTVSGAGSDYWSNAELTQYDLWSNTDTLGTVAQPWTDYKSRAWVELNISTTTIMFQRRYNGSVRARTAIGNACIGTKTRFNALFAVDIDYDTTAVPSPTPCPVTEVTTLTPASNTDGLSGANYQEGSATATYALGGSDTNGWCWKGGDNNSNTFLGHAGWNQAAYDCVGAGHLGYVGVFENGSTQYENTDITGTNWLNGSSTTLTEVSFFAR